MFQTFNLSNCQSFKRPIFQYLICLSNSNLGTFQTLKVWKSWKFESLKDWHIERLEIVFVWVWKPKTYRGIGMQRSAEKRALKIVFIGGGDDIGMSWSNCDFSVFSDVKTCFLDSMEPKYFFQTKHTAQKTMRHRYERATKVAIRTVFATILLAVWTFILYRVCASRTERALGSWVLLYLNNYYCWTRLLPHPIKTPTKRQL